MILGKIVSAVSVDSKGLHITVEDGDTYDVVSDVAELDEVSGGIHLGDKVLTVIDYATTDDRSAYYVTTHKVVVDTTGSRATYSWVIVDPDRPVRMAVPNRP